MKDGAEVTHGQPVGENNEGGQRAIHERAIEDLVNVEQMIAQDSNANPATGSTPTFTLAAGQNETTIDAGLRKQMKYTTYTQGGWGAVPSGSNPGTLLVKYFSSLYPKGVVAGGTYKITLTSQPAVTAFLPTGTTPGVLTKNYTNPVATTSGGILAGQVLALRFNIDFSAAGVFPVGLGNLRISPALSAQVAGQTVTQVSTLANTVLGGNTGALPAGMSVSDLNNVVMLINGNFDGGTVDNGLLY